MRVVASELLFTEQAAGVLPPRAAMATSAFFFTIHQVIDLKAQLAWNVTLLAPAGVFVGGIV